MAKPMVIINREEGEVCIVELNGEIDANTAPSISSEVLDLTKTKSKILIDLTKVTYMSSAGLRMLLKLLRTVTSNSGQLVLVGLSEEVEDTMKVTGFLQFFTTCPTVEAGLTKLT
jgi:anti-sigma B factor antagonist